MNRRKIKMDKKADFAYWHLLIILLAIATILFAVLWYTDLGSQIKEVLSTMFDIF
jgi:hypothetical protein